MQVAVATPESADHQYALGRSYKSLGQYAAAERAYREALRLRPQFTEAWISLGILLRHLGRANEAEQCHREAQRLDPRNLVALLNLVNALLSQERYAQAADVTRAASVWLEETANVFRERVERTPDSPEAHNNLGRVMLMLRPSEAARHFRAALDLNPCYLEAAESLGRCLQDTGQFDGAVEAFRVATRLQPTSLELQLALANAYRTAQRLEEATALYESILRRDPHSARAKGGLAATLADRGQFTKPKALFEQALTALPDDPGIRFGYALVLLRSGEFAKGWRHYESRWRTGPAPQAIERAFTQPRWKGESLEGKTLLVCCEQGLGDELMFSSVLPDILRESDHCIVECDARLASLFRRSFPTATVFGVDRSQPEWNRALERNAHSLPAFDYWTPAGSLPLHQRSVAERFPKHAGYLVADSARIDHWRSRLAELGPGLKVGISWRGGTVLSRTNNRSIPLDALRPILATGGAHFVNLQYGDASAEISAFTAATGIPIHHYQEAHDDYGETANLVGALDLVISVCTAVVHLCGALGRPVWVMAPSVAEWRYGHEGPSMIWYPSVRMFRQSTAGAWEPVITQVTRTLQKTLRAEAGR
jgi:Flp pilus assembly protein TadD